MVARKAPPSRSSKSRARRARVSVAEPSRVPRRPRAAPDDDTTRVERAAGTPPRSRQRDPFHGLYEPAQILAPPYSYDALCRLFDDSDALAAAIAAMEVNTGAFGLQFVPVDGAIPDDARAAAEA